MTDIKRISSFDVFDTLLARRCLHPTDIFDKIEKSYPFVGFKSLRIQSEMNTFRFDDIYQNFQKLTSISDQEIEQMKEFEIQTEINNSYLIMSNYNLVKDGDILISDMYLSSEQIMRILRAIGFKKNVTVYSSSSGKSKYDGSMYQYLKKMYNITLHIGDNEHSDIKMASLNKIKCNLTTIHKLTPEEEFFINIGCKDFALLIREFRHQNPYYEKLPGFMLYNHQARFNIPFLIILSQQLNEILLRENRDTLLFTTRDCCLLKHIFSAIYPNYKSVTFESSRRMYAAYNDEYKNYLKSIYDDKKCLIVDLNGSFYTGRPLFMDVFGKLPRVHLASYNKYRDAIVFEGLTFSINQCRWGDAIEEFSTDIQGTLIDMKDGKFIRHPFEFNMNDGLVYKDCILRFCEFIRDKRILDFIDLPQLLEKFTTSCCFRPNIRRLIKDDDIPWPQNTYKRIRVGFRSNKVFNPV